MADLEATDSNTNNRLLVFLRKKSTLLVVSVFILITITGIFLYQIFYIKSSDDIKIGDQTITKKQIDNYENELRLYNKENNISLKDKSPRQAAVDDLVLNASLKNELNNYKLNLSNDDLYVSIDPDLKSQMGPSEYKNYLAGSSVILRIVKENKALQSKLDKSLITRRDIFIVAINLDTPYYLQATDSDKPKLLNDAQSRMQKLERLVKQNISKESISKKVDVQYFGEGSRSSNTDELGKFYNGPVTTVDYKEGYQVDQQYFNDLDSGSFMSYKPKKWYNTDEQIKKLKNKGDTTPIFASKTGNLMIVRLESINNAKFNSWNEALGFYKKKYLPKNYKEFSSSKPMMLSNKESRSGIIENVLFKNVSAEQIDCPAHRIKFNLVSVDINTGKSIGGTKLTVDNNNYTVFYFKKAVNCVINFKGQMPKTLDQYKSYTYTTDSSADGINYYDTCYSFEPTWTVKSHPADSIWQPVSPTKKYYYRYMNPTAFKQGGKVVEDRIFPASHGWGTKPGEIQNNGVMVKTDYNNSASSDTPPLKPGLPEGFPSWQEGNLNNNKWTNIYFYYRRIPKVETRTSVTPNSVKLNNNITFTHSVKNTSPYPIDYKFIVRRYKVTKSSTTASQIDANAQGSTTLGISVVNVTLKGEKQALLTANNVPSNGYNPNNVNDVFMPTTANSHKVGDKVCEKIFAESLQYGGSKTYSSNAVCSVVAANPPPDPTTTTTSKYPFFQAINGSVLAGCNLGLLSGYYNNNSVAPNGSGTTLASISNNAIVGFASSIGSNYGPAGLSFANTNTTVDSTSPTLGGLFKTNCARTQVSVATNNINYTDSDALTNTGVKNYKNDATIGNSAAQTIAAGKRITVNVDGNVYIKNNIKYASDSSWSDSVSIPSLVIRATGNIYIDQNVTRLDGTYVANNAIFTCVNSSKTPILSLFGCNKQLLVYGSFIANKINLLRTLGDINDSNPASCNNNSGTVKEYNNCAAEVFVKSPEIYINGTNTGNENTTKNPYNLIKNMPPIL
ncbi:MAG: hypothetical protein WCF91_02850 [bacterium]